MQYPGTTIKAIAYTIISQIGILLLLLLFCTQMNMIDFQLIEAAKKTNIQLKELNV